MGLFLSTASYTRYKSTNFPLPAAGSIVVIVATSV